MDAETMIELTIVNEFNFEKLKEEILKFDYNKMLNKINDSFTDYCTNGIKISIKIDARIVRSSIISSVIEEILKRKKYKKYFEFRNDIAGLFCSAIGEEEKERITDILLSGKNVKPKSASKVAKV